VGFDDSIIALSTHPPLSSVRQSMEQMGRELVNVLLQSAASPSSVVRHVVLETELVVRESSAVGPVSRNDRTHGRVTLPARLSEGVGDS
jgi:DNA-binding LacI/PurR family transcriptional regulator